MTFALIVTGLSAGVLSGFFGVGGGTVTVPLLLLLGFDIKSAIGISVMQMSATSIFGSFLNHQKAVFDASKTWTFLVGGALGGVTGGVLMSHADGRFLAIALLAFVLFTLVKLYISSPLPSGEAVHNPPLFVAIGLAVGAAGSMVGIGGALLLTPILVGYLNFPLKQAIGISLFYVVSTSLFAFLTVLTLGHIDLVNGFWVAITSLAGVWIGIKLALLTDAKRHKKLIVALYLLICASLAYKIFLGL